MDIMALSVEELRAELLAYACRLLGDFQEAEDCVQNAFLSAVRAESHPDQPRAWFYRVVHNLAMNAARARDRRSPPAPRPESLRSTHAEDHAKLERALAELPEEQRAILLLRYVHELDFDEITKIIGRPLGTTKVYAGRALSALQKWMRRQP